MVTFDEMIIKSRWIFKYTEELILETYGFHLLIYK